MKKLCKSKTEKKICGVCGGIAEYLQVDPTIIRLILLLIICLGWGTGVIVYFAAALIMPDGE
ncbi:MAG: PspC domain-containing protein [Clostridia bacterium]|nr:PspC domain-containing protein [Clostridia bacterium]